ncbi:MAG TPA: ABC transporter permease [Vicinamibacterales bacterium]|nr:ABC transporter permease [Vicinamibacterales bacterium]
MISLSTRLLRLLLRTYPLEFRERFGGDLEADFEEILHTRGRAAAWRYALSDLRRAIPMTHTDDQRARQRRYAVTLGGESHMGTLTFDVRHSLRALWKSPVFTVITVLTLALGIGANSAIFSLVNAVLLRPIGYEDPDRLMMIHEIIPESKVPRFGVSPSDYLDLEQMQGSFTHIGAYRTRTMELSGTGTPETVSVAETSAAVFPLLGANAAIGRTFLPEEDRSEQSVVVISESLRRRRFAASSPIGERLNLDRKPYTIVGVMAPGFEFPKRGPDLNSQPADVYLPLVFNPFERQARAMFYNHSVIGRLKDGVSMEQAARDTAALASRVVTNYPAQIRNSGMTLQIAATPMLEEIAGQVRRPLLILLGAVGLVLLVACANVANLFLSRAVARQRELGVRVALGASRHRLFQMLLIESVLLALAGGALGLLIGNWAIRAVPAVITTSLPGVSDVSLDIRVVSFTFVLSIATALFFGLVPMIGMKRELADVLREGARAVGGRQQHRLQAGLVITSVAFAFVLLVASGLLIRSFNKLMNTDSGISELNVLSLEVSLPHAGYNQAARVRSFYQSVHERITAIPGVKAGVVTTDLPLRPDGERRAFTAEGTDPNAGIPASIALTWAHGDYFSTFGIPLIRGRNFSNDEQMANRLVVIVSKNLADAFWPGEDPIGKRLKWGLTSSPASWQTVIGVAGDVVDGPLGSDPVIHVYSPYSETNDQGLASPTGGLWRRMNIAVKGDVDASSLATSVRAAITAIDPALAVTRQTTMAEVVGEASAPQRFSATVLTAFAAGALLLAGIGLYGVLAFGVAQRRKEIGVRLALGAGRGEVLGLVVKRGMMLAGAGLVIGLAGSIAASRLLQSLLFETDIYDPFTFVAVPVLLAVVSLAACYVPARRAAVVDPMVTLRTE